MRSSPVLLRKTLNDEIVQEWTEGTYWATADIALYFARYRSRNNGQCGGGPSLLAIRLADLEAAGAIVADEQCADAPVERPSMDLESMYRAFDVSNGGWQNSLAIFGSVVSIGRVNHKDIVLLEGVLPSKSLFKKDGDLSGIIEQLPHDHDSKFRYVARP